MLGQHCHDLRDLSLRTCHLLTDIGVSALTACTELRTIDVSGNTRITSQGIITLAQACTKLEEIGIPRCDEHIDLAVAALVIHCSALKVVRCYSTYFTDTALQYLQNCILLHTLELKNSWKVGNVTSTALLQLLDHCVALQGLELSYVLLNTAGAAVRPQTTTAANNSLVYIEIERCTALTDSAFVALISRCPNVVHLDISGCTGLSDASILAVASHCTKKLEVLNISNISAVSDASLCAIVQSCCHLRSLRINGCRLLTDFTARAIGNNCPNLRELSIVYCTNLSDVGIIEILQKCCLLRYVSSRLNVTKSVLDAVMQHGARLRFLGLRKCDNIDEDAVSAFRSAMPNCKLLFS